MATQQHLDRNDRHSPNGHLPSNGLPASSPHLPRWRNYTAFVLSGGTARGALQVGALRALLEREIRPDVIIGTSIGAWNGAWLARNPTLESIAALEDLWRTVHPVRVLLGREPLAGSPQQAVRGVLMLAAAQRFAAGHPSLYGNAGLKNFVKKAIGDATFEQMQVPLHIIATDITHGRRKIFSSGPIAPAALATAAIPGIFPPVRIGDAVYVDGGAVDNASIETALVLGARRIFVVDVGYDDSNSGAALWSEDTAATVKPRGNSSHALGAVLERTVQVVSRYQIERALARVPRGVEVHVIHAATGARGGSLDFERAPVWMKQGYVFTQKYLESRLPTAKVTLNR
jgi:NTE family protein